ncbi:ClpX, ATPase regulatory subunit [Obba rivulosa]|uniref:ClpX, ATPase regulatory subunit n=1 Tax=Obba rivulosa TaxID=1052685 RepID=A0A8E2J3W0_9APHY|nr:ClpX, ATPase regulatory subunit [Obba rivulosa]
MTWRAAATSIPSLRRSVRHHWSRAHYLDSEPEVPPNSRYRKPLATPRQLVEYLNKYVVGQENAKKVLSVAVFNHYNRVMANMSSMTESAQEEHWAETLQPDDLQSGVSSAHIHPHPYRLPMQSIAPPSRHPLPTFEKSNVLVIGPTGSGKTLLAKTLARVLDVPFSVSDATSFTQAGYVGDDVDMCIQRLLQSANWDPYRASMGIVYIDEVDKVARKTSNGMDGTRDVGGEGVQQALLRMMEGSVVTVPAKGAPAMPPPMASDARSRAGRPMNMGPMANPRPESYSIDTSNVLFILSGAFVGLDSIIKRRMDKGSIGFTAPLAHPTEEASTDSKGMPFFTPNKNKVSMPNFLNQVEPRDLVQYGFIPEFISRMPSITTLEPLTIPDLRRVLSEVRGSLISQYTTLFACSDIDIKFTGAALDEICRKAAERGGGARGLRGIMEALLLEPMYEAPGSSIRHILINEAVARGEKPAQSWNYGEGPKCWAAWAEEEERLKP